MNTSTPQLELYWLGGSPHAWRVMLALEAKRLPYVSHLLEVSRGDLKTEDYLRLNPRGKVPTLRHGNLVLAESLAIMEYLDEAFPAVPLYGRTAHERAHTRRLVSEGFSYFADPVLRIIAPIYFGKAAERAADIRESIPKAHAELERQEAALGNAAWFGKDAIGAADVALYPFVKSLLRAAGKEGAAEFELGLLPFESRYPRLAAWMDRVESSPGYERTYPPNWGAPPKVQRREEAAQAV